jgi:hypothetical protein
MAGGAGAHRRHRTRGRNGAVRTQLPWHRRFRARHSAHLHASDRTARPGCVWRRRDRAKRRTCEHRAGGADGERCRRRLHGLDRKRGGARARGLRGLSARGCQHQGDRRLRRADSQAATLSGDGGAGARARQAGRAVVVRAQRGRARVRQVAYRRACRRLRRDRSAAAACLRHAGAQPRRADRCHRAGGALPVAAEQGAGDGDGLRRHQRTDARHLRGARARTAAAARGACRDHSGGAAGFRRCLQPARPHGAGDHAPRNVRPHHQAAAGGRQLRQPAADGHHRGGERFCPGQGQGMPRAAGGLIQAGE